MTISIPEVSAKTLPELLSLAGRRAVVTGGGQGLGKAIALRLAEAGASVLIADINGELADSTAKDIRDAHGGAALGALMDVTNPASVDAAATLAVDTLGGIDIWVNNAGIFPAVPVLEMSEETWDQVFAVNSRGVFLGSKAAARQMAAAQTGGVIVNVVSTAGFRGTAPGLAAYVGSKHAARGMTKQMALEFAPLGIRVLGVAPTFVPTEGNMAAAAAASSLRGDEEAAPVMPVMQQSLLGRFGVPDDIARVVLFCASDLSVFMTGSTLLADAGQTI